jgi:hypothetical protein
MIVLMETYRISKSTYQLELMGAFVLDYEDKEGGCSYCRSPCVLLAAAAIVIATATVIAATAAAAATATTAAAAATATTTAAAAAAAEDNDKDQNAGARISTPKTIAHKRLPPFDLQYIILLWRKWCYKILWALYEALQG